MNLCLPFLEEDECEHRAELLRKGIERHEELVWLREFLDLELGRLRGDVTYLQFAVQISGEG